MDPDDGRDAGAAAPGAGLLLTPAEAARILGVDPRTVARWADEGRLAVVRTVGGHRRYPAEAVVDLSAGAEARGRGPVRP